MIGGLLEYTSCELLHLATLDTYHGAPMAIVDTAVQNIGTYTGLVSIDRSRFQWHVTPE